MKKGYQGNEPWTAVSPTTGKREFVDPEGEFIAGETICKRLDGYAPDGCTLETAD